MKIVQTFWSGNKNLAEDSFGWLSPKYHLEGWALSFLRLRKFYNQIELYTDKKGYKMLIDKLQLPYTNVHVIYDDLIEKYPPGLWALPKIFTYSRQKEPFIHVDGDLFIWEKFPGSFYKSGLIVQNLEVATTFYENFYSNIFKRLKYTPHYLQWIVQKEICACNFGIFGGNDIEFIQEYTDNVFKFVNKNYENIPGEYHNCFNVIFEQILFYELAKHHHKNIECLIDSPIDDYGYGYEIIADFTQAPYKKTFLHLIGGNKRDQTACRLMELNLLKEFPYHYDLINKLVTEKNHNINSGNNNGVSGYIRQYPYTSILQKKFNNNLDNAVEGSQPDNYNTDNALIKSCKNFDEEVRRLHISNDKEQSEKIIERDAKVIEYFRFLHEDKDFQLSCLLYVDPLVKFIETVYDWTKIQNMSSKEIEKIETENNFYFAFVPEKEDFSLVFLEDLDRSILVVLEEKKYYKDLLEDIEKCFDQDDIQDNYDNFLQLILIKLNFMIANKLIRLTLL